jgi:hypothetical protein
MNFIPSQEFEDPEMDTDHRHKLKEMTENNNVAH